MFQLFPYCIFFKSFLYSWAYQFHAEFMFKSVVKENKLKKKKS